MEYSMGKHGGGRTSSVAERQLRTRTRTTIVKPLSVKQRGENATLSLRQALNLPVADGDTTAFGTALAEIAAEESMHNTRFVDAIRARYHDLIAQQPAPKRGGSKAELPALVPIRRIEGYRADPFSPPDPHFLAQLYGTHQLNRALQDYTLDKLKDTAANVQAAHPGTKPTSKSSKQAVIDYIARYSTGA
jgi:hypothetical protein